MTENEFVIFSAATADIHEFADDQCEALKDAYFELR